MSAHIHDITAVAEACAASDPASGAEGLANGLGRLWPALSFKPVLTRGGWYRSGAVVDIDHQRVAASLRQWAESQAPNGDIQPLLELCLERQLFSTRLVGRTHYLTAQTGPAAADFMQLEVEELQEVLERYLSDPDWLPDSLEEFIDPLDNPQLEPEPVGVARLAFRRLFAARELIDPLDSESGEDGLLRFMRDWEASSAAAHSGHFCDHWVLGVRESTDRDGAATLTAQPVAADTLERLQVSPGLRGGDLAARIHAFDHQAGYPMAWYFHMVAAAGVPFAIGIQVAEDHDAGFDYLPERDLVLLRRWLTSPFRA